MEQRSVLVTFGPLTASLAAGYGVLFTMLDDYRDQYGINEGALGAIIGIGFVSGFVAQVLIGPLADRGHARRLVLAGVFLNVAGLMAMALATAFVPLLLGRLVMGVGVGMAMPAIRRIVILSEPDRLGHNLGRLLSIDVAGFNRTLEVTAPLAQVQPWIYDNIDGDKIMRDSPEWSGIPQSWLKTEDEVAGMREDRASAESEANAVETAKPVADSLKSIAQAQQINVESGIV